MIKKGSLVYYNPSPQEDDVVPPGLYFVCNPNWSSIDITIYSKIGKAFNGFDDWIVPIKNCQLIIE